MMNTITYYPVVKWKTGERKALEHLKNKFNYLNFTKTASYIALPEIETDTYDFKKTLFSYVQKQSKNAELENNQKVKSNYDWLMHYVLED